MALVQWSTGLCVGIKEIDEQHQQLFGLINKLNDAHLQGRGREVRGEILNELIDYTQKHFGIEEEYFARYKYPEAVPHCMAHAEFVAKVVEFKNDLLKNKIALSLDIMQFMSEWLKKHIMGTDMEYVTFFKENGVDDVERGYVLN